MTQKPNHASHSHHYRWGRVALVALAGTLILALGVGLVTIGLHTLLDRSSAESENNPAGAEQTAQGQEPAFTSGSSSFTFSGVGDNLLHDTIFVYYEEDHGNRDFSPIYEMTNPYTRTADLSYVNFETVCAGDAYGLSGYPDFNGPTEMIDTLAGSGFNWFSLSSNHSMDAGMDGLIEEIQYTHDHQPQISTSGAYRSAEESETSVVRDINGIRVGLTSFAYGLNGYSKPEGADWLIDVYRKDDGSIDYDLVRHRMEELNAKSDVQIVSVHWGEEYQTQPTEEQQQLARFLSEQGAEAIIGSHPHVIQPVEFIQTGDQKTLVYYSLGNFVSAQNTNETMVGGMARFQLTYDFGNQASSFQDVQFIPTITWISPDLRTYRTTTIQEYTDDMARNHYITTLDMPITRQWVSEYVESVVGHPDDIDVVLA